MNQHKPPHRRRRDCLLSFVLLLCSSWSAPATAEDAPQERVRWLNQRLTGSPEPPPPYTVEKTFRKIEWKAPMYIAPEPGTDKLWVVLQGGEKLGPGRVLRVPDDPDAGQTETLSEMEDRLIYGLTFHPDYEANGFVFLFSNGPREAKERTNRISRLMAKCQ